MGDSDDDWFEKDIDEIVQKVQKKKDPNAASSNDNLSDASLQAKGVPKFLVDADYGGNYELPKENNSTKQVQKSTKVLKGEKGFVQTISYKKLSFISELSPLNVFLEVTQADCGFFESFNESHDFIILIIKVFNKLCDLPLEEFKKEFLTKFVNANESFYEGLSSLLKKIFADKYKNTKSIIQVNVLEIVRELLGVFTSVCKYQLQNIPVKNAIKSLVGYLSTTGSSFADVKATATALHSKMMKHDPEAKEIYPTLKELTTTTEEEIKPNIVKGKYDSIQNYLTVHLSLLREDFIIPLREAIQELKSAGNLQDLPSNKVYPKVRILLNDVLNSKTRKGEMLIVDLRPDERNNTTITSASPDTNNWINPKKLMYGSLLCFTTSLEFENLVLAVVSNREIDALQRGYIQIEIVKMYNIGKIFETDFIMLESDVYFEPYNYVHRVLRGLDEKSFPMANYIVNVDGTHHPPDYLNTPKPLTYEFKKHHFNPLDHKSYPTEKSLRMNPSQTEAYHHALSNKFALIQGPPGTGKTYIGMKIISTLLCNVDAQILVICYTNHALDQFLSGMLKATDDIVRMGNQSKHELLDKYNIKQMTDATVTDRRLKGCFYQTKNEYLKKLQDFEALQKEFDGTEEQYEKILAAQNELRKISRKLDELKQISDYNSIKDKKVIGMTTTCAARCNLLLQLLKTPIVIVEEAAEVLESHIIASLTKETQHVILIGDHYQLRPTTSVYKLSQKCKMDISLFERMINNQLNCVCLTTQHRMRPEIADLIRPNIYKNLVDHDSVLSYEKIRGMRKSMFFVTHDYKESKFKDETTKRNVHEAQFLCALANYLLMQSYKPEDIVLLTTYNGQMIQLLNERKQFPHLQKVRVTVVDNYQGEESKIVLLSLVRNNDENRVGYLGMKNRICVALSRAREGFYVIGSMRFMAKNNPIWNEINAKLVEQEAIGDALPLECDRHGTLMMMKTASDFEQVKFGGCQQRCDIALPCGHRCGYMCHWEGFEHSAKCTCE